MSDEKKPFDQRAYIDKWQKENYDRVYVRIEKGEKETLKSYAGQVGESLNEFIRGALSDRICRLIKEGRIKSGE